MQLAASLIKFGRRHKNSLNLIVRIFKVWEI